MAVLVVGGFFDPLTQAKSDNNPSGPHLAQFLTGRSDCVSKRRRFDMLYKLFKVGKWVIIADLSAGVVINAAWAMGLINPLGWGVHVANAIQTTLQ
ncbi:MAG: hypothetical protein ABJO51_06250 [Anderseniella sp.]